MAAIYEDNFGFWEIDCPEEHAFFQHVKSQSVRTMCQRCDRLVRLMSTKNVCAPCVSALEYGAPTSMRKYRHAGPKTASQP
jgi:ribosomal protein L37E